MTDTDLGLMAHRLGQKIVAMYAKAGMATSSPFGLGSDYDSTIVGSVILDAEDFTTLDPAKIIDEYERMDDVRKALAEDAQAVADLDQIASVLAVNWAGEAADRFHDQLKFIREFMTQSSVRVERAIVAMGLAFRVAVDVRSNYLVLAENSIVACEQEMAAQEVRDAEAEIKVTSTVVNSVIGMFTKDPAEIAKQGMQTFVNMTAALKEIELKASGAPQVVDAYTLGRDQVRRDFEESLNLLREWADRESDALGNDAVPLMRPLPSSYSPSSPDFRYESFESGYRPPGDFGPRVEQHRVEVSTSDPTSVVSRRLDAQ